MTDNKKPAPNQVIYKSGSPAKVRTAVKLKYYMDVGAWDRGQNGQAITTFGVISGHDILLCNWLTRSAGGTELNTLIRGSSCIIEYDNQSYELSPSLNSFVRFARAAKRCYLLNVMHTPKSIPLTDPNQIIFIFPDLHLPLFKGEPLDRFCWGYNYDTLMSLDEELDYLLKFANNNSFDVITVQVGDMYEIWEAEIILRQQYLALLKEASKIDVLRHGWRVMVEDGQIIPVKSNYYDFREAWGKAFQHGFQTHDGTELPRGLELFVNDVNDYGISIFDTERIKAGIRRAHGKLFKKKEALFTYEIAGNHDNNLSNLYWEKHSPDEYLDSGYLQRYSNIIRKDLQRAHATLTHPTKKGNNVQRFKVLGLNNGIWIEHGHKYDWHNNDDDWHKPDHGFDIVHKYDAGIINEMFKIRSSESGADFARQIANRWTDFQDYEMRLPGLQRADVIFNANPSINLVIMGHTHSPLLQSSPDGLSFFESLPGHENYKNSDYCLPEARLTL